MGPDDQLMHCLKKTERRQVVGALHLGPLGDHFAAIITINPIRSAVRQSGCEGFHRNM